jgi:hypothetical protein
MQNLGMSKNNLNKQPLSFMIQLGIIEMSVNKAFRFLPPVYRFVDMFLEFANDEQWSSSTEQAEIAEKNSVSHPITSEHDESDDSEDINE